LTLAFPATFGEKVSIVLWVRSGLGWQRLGFQHLRRTRRLAKAMYDLGTQMRIRRKEAIVTQRKIVMLYVLPLQMSPM